MTHAENQKQTSENSSTPTSAVFKGLLVNLYGGPGSGKSTLAAGLFYYLKRLDYKVELVREAAKDLAYGDGLHGTLTQQKFLLSEQWARQAIYYRHVDIIITDSPLLLGVMYTPEPDEEYEHKFNKLYKSAPNTLDFLVERWNRVYQTYGRKETEDEARTLDRRIRRELLLRGIEAMPIASSSQGVSRAMALVESHWQALLVSGKGHSDDVSGL